MATLIDANQAMFTPFEPKMKNRYLMSIDGIPAYLIKTAARPSITFEEVTLEHMNVKRYVKGKATWETIEITLYDPDFYKKDIDFQVLGPVGDVVEQWKLKGAFITSANFNDLDFSSSDPLDITLTLRYDYAILEF